MTIDKDGRHDSEIERRINLGRYTISTMNGVYYGMKELQGKIYKYLQGNKNILYGSEV
jgi:hypothetical protein